MNDRNGLRIRRARPGIPANAAERETHRLDGAGSEHRAELLRGPCCRGPSLGFPRPGETVLCKEAFALQLLT